MKNNQHFDLNSFIAPDISHAPVYVWVWNDVCTREKIDAQLAEMQNLGIRAFYLLPEPATFRPDSMPTYLSPDYLSQEYFALCAYAAQKANECNMLCWLYDEGGWPSGSACGRVMKDHPEYARQVLKAHERAFSAGETYQKSTPAVLAAFLRDREMVSEGHVFSETATVTEYVAQMENGSYPDLLNRKATEYFLEITHEKYSRTQNLTAVFTDEPKAQTNAFNQALAGEYEAAYGESILPHLPLLAGRTAATQENVHILHRWYDICSRMFCDHYLLVCKQWANAHGMAFTGHLDKDHEPLGCMHGGSFNLMRALRCFDIPGVDVIWRQLYPENKTAVRNDMNAYNGFFPRYASSAAAHNGTKQAMSEIFAVAGAGLTYDIMRFTAGALAVRGINIFNLFSLSLGQQGAFLAQEPPVYTQTQPYCRYLSQFNRYLERLSYVSSLGERVCSTALYYPVCDLQGRLHAAAVAEQFDRLGRSLEDRTVDFDIVDDDVIRSATGVQKGCLQIGNAQYRHVVIPENAFVPPETQKVLQEFAENGGQITHEPAATQPVVFVEGAGLRAMHRKTENAELLLLFREAGESGEYTVHLPSSNGYLADLFSGTLQKIAAENGVFRLSLAVGETAVLLLTDEEMQADDQKELTQCFSLADGFCLRREQELTCKENGFANIGHTDQSIPVVLGDWTGLLGSAYSGSGVYETVFSLPEDQIGKQGALDLGEVRYAAQVHLNGVCLGSALMPPYRVKIPAGVLQKNNKLTISVANTSANWYVHTDYFNQYSSKELSPYFEGAKEYAKDFVSGGLFGPVVFYLQ